MGKCNYTLFFVLLMTTALFARPFEPQCKPQNITTTTLPFSSASIEIWENHLRNTAAQTSQALNQIEAVDSRAWKLEKLKDWFVNLKTPQSSQVRKQRLEGLTQAWNTFYAPEIKSGHMHKRIQIYESELPSLERKVNDELAYHTKISTILNRWKTEGSAYEGKPKRRQIDEQKLADLDQALGRVSNPWRTLYQIYFIYVPETKNPTGNIATQLKLDTIKTSPQNHMQSIFFKLADEIIRLYASQPPAVYASVKALVDAYKESPLTLGFMFHWGLNENRAAWLTWYVTYIGILREAQELLVSGKEVAKEREYYPRLTLKEPPLPRQEVTQFLKRAPYLQQEITCTIGNILAVDPHKPNDITYYPRPADLENLRLLVAQTVNPFVREQLEQQAHDKANLRWFGNTLLNMLPLHSVRQIVHDVRSGEGLDILALTRTIQTDCLILSFFGITARAATALSAVENFGSLSTRNMLHAGFAVNYANTAYISLTAMQEKDPIRAGTLFAFALMGGWSAYRFSSKLGLHEQIAGTSSHGTPESWGVRDHRRPLPGVDEIAQSALRSGDSSIGSSRLYEHLFGESPTSMRPSTGNTSVATKPRVAPQNKTTTVPKANIKESPDHAQAPQKSSPTASAPYGDGEGYEELLRKQLQDTGLPEDRIKEIIQQQRDQSLTEVDLVAAFVGGNRDPWILSQLRLKLESCYYEEFSEACHILASQLGEYFIELLLKEIIPSPKLKILLKLMNTQPEEMWYDLQRDLSESLIAVILKMDDETLVSEKAMDRLLTILDRWIDLVEGLPLAERRQLSLSSELIEQYIAKVQSRYFSPNTQDLSEEGLSYLKKIIGEIPDGRGLPADMNIDAAIQAFIYGYRNDNVREMIREQVRKCHTGAQGAFDCDGFFRLIKKRLLEFVNFDGLGAESWEIILLKQAILEKASVSFWSKLAKHLFFSEKYFKNQIRVLSKVPFAAIIADSSLLAAFQKDLEDFDKNPNADLLNDFKALLILCQQSLNIYFQKQGICSRLDQTLHRLLASRLREDGLDETLIQQILNLDEQDLALANRIRDYLYWDFIFLNRDIASALETYVLQLNKKAQKTNEDELKTTLEKHIQIMNELIQNIKHGH